ncbi:MAG: hypothetical protein HY903_11350 [Deltaproteobacteria bacterium]|nr:hypothetical protein [Deltaproteobacteria bacterium]
MPLPLSTQTYVNSSGQIAVAPSPQSPAQGYSPTNGTRTDNGYTVFRNNGGSGSAMDSSGNIRTGHFDIRPNSGRSVFVADHYG